MGGIWQLSWQITAIMAAGDKLSAQPVLAFSCVLSIASMAYKGIMQAVEVWRNPPPDSFTTLLVFGPAIIIGLAVIAFALRLFMSDYCEEHSWNMAFPLDQGCVTFPVSLH